MGVLKFKSLIAAFLIIIVGVSGFPFTPIYAASTTITDTVTIPFTEAQEFSSSEYLSNVAVNLSSSIPNGYQIKSYAVWKMASSGSLVNKGTYNSTLTSSNKLTIPSFQGAIVDVEADGWAPDMYFAVNRRSNGKQFIFSTQGQQYTITPKSGDACWENNLAVCLGTLGTTDDNGKSMPIGTVRTAQGWGIAISDGFDGPEKYKHNDSNSSVPRSDVIDSSIEITEVNILDRYKDYVKVVSKGGSGGYGTLSLATPLTADNPFGEDAACTGCTGYAMTLKYPLESTTSWVGQTYMYAGEVRVTYEPIPATDEPYVTCDCEAAPSSIEFANADVSVKSTLTATVKDNQSRTVKNWTVYGRANDGSQLTTKTSIGSGQSSISTTFSFTISKSLLTNVDSYTETWVMRARVYFTDGTTAEQAIECTTTVYKPGAATPEPSPSEDPDDQEVTPTPTPEPTPDPPRIAEADIEFDPDWIIAGEESSLLNYSTKYDDYEWTFSDNLSEVITDADKKKFEDLQFDEPGTYQATLKVWNDEGSEDSASAILEVVDPKPVAVVTGPVKIIQGREFPYLHNLLNSYTPLESRGEAIDFTKSEYRYKNTEDSSYTTGWPAKGPDEIGTYSIEGKVYDTTGRVSDWGTLKLQVVADEPPTVSLVSPETAYRNGEQTIFLDGKSPDGDQLVQLVVQERYDDDDDGNFDEEPWTSIYTGAYESTLSVKYTTVGSRQYRAQVKEDYGLVSSWSELDETEILNYAPEVDFDAYGLTTQPGEDSLPPTTTLTPSSVYNSWKLKTPYTGGDASKLPWKADSTYLSTKNAQYPNYYVDYPNTGLGPNSRSVNDLASDLYAATPWQSGGTVFEHVFINNRIYTYQATTTETTINERNSVTGEVLRTFTIPGKVKMIDDKEQFYTTTVNSTTRILTLNVYNNEGTLVDTIDMSYGSTISDDSLSVGIADYKFTDDDTILTLSMSYVVGNYVYMYQIRYSLATRSVIWEVPLSSKINYNTYSIENVKMTAGSDGTMYTTFRKENWEESYLHESYLAWVTPNGVAKFVTLTDADGASYPTVSNDGAYIYVNTMELTSSSKGRDHYFLTYNASTGKLVGDYQLGENGSGWTSSMTEQVINPAVLSDGNVISVNLFAKDGETIVNNFADVPNFQQVSSNIFIDSSGQIIIPRAEYIRDYGKIQTYLDVYNKNGTKIKTYKNPFLSTKGYTEAQVPANSSDDPAVSSTSILPDGSIYLFSHGYVMPYVGASAPTGYPKAIDDNTVEVMDDTWGGLWYDPYTTQKNGAISFNVKIDSNDSDDTPIGAAIAVQDEKNMYSVEWTGTKLTLYKAVGGTKTSLKSTSLTRLAGTTYAFKLEAQNGTLNVYINNIKKLTASDSKFTTGSLGLLAIGQEQAKFSSITLTNYGDTYIEKTAFTVLVNEEIEYDTVFSDLESDPKYAEKWTYEHDPSYFANPEGTSQYDGQTYSSPLESLDKPGLYEITYQAQDNPGLSNYRLWSEGMTKELYVHRRPIAAPDVRLTGMVYAAGEALDYDTYDASYDPDVPDYLAERKFRYRWADSSVWTDGQLQLYNRAGVELIIQEQVKDIHGAWSYWAETRVYEAALPAVNQTAPVMTITAPSGTSSSPTVYLTDPTLKWTYYDKENDSQELFYLKLTYADTGESIMEVTYPGSDISFILEEGTVEPSRKVKVMGRVYSNGAWSADSNTVYFMINTPPMTTLLSYNGPDADSPVYTQSKTPVLQVKVTDAEGQSPKYIDYEVYYNSTGELETDTNSTTSATSYTPASLKEGLHVWKARAYDGYAWGEFSAKGYFFVDSVKPRDTEEVLQISPTSVTVTFNPFSDAAPSSGHASRGFYMQKVNADGSVTAMDLNGNGTADSSVALAKTASSYTVNGLTSGQRYRLMVMDYDVAGNEGEYEYIYFVTNQPPAADFDWSPKPVYEGDAVSFSSAVSDPDGDSLTAVYELISPSGEEHTYSYSFSSPYPSTGPNIRMSEVGKWTMKLTVSDGTESVETEKTVTVLPLVVAGYVGHTELWEEHRKTYNRNISGDEESPRTASTFWAGEKFMLQADTTLTGTDTDAERVEARMGTYTVALARSGADRTIWTGELWNERFAELEDGPYVFTFTAYYSNGTSKTAKVTVEISGTAEELLGVHRVR